MAAHLTHHARARMQQRGIGPEALECLLEYGREAFDHRGGVILYLDKAARRRIAREEGRARAPGKRLDLYAVLGDDGRVRTVGHRYRRIPRS
jgi:hypothetical protein